MKSVIYFNILFLFSFLANSLEIGEYNAHCENILASSYLLKILDDSIELEHQKIEENILQILHSDNEEEEYQNLVIKLFWQRYIDYLYSSQELRVEETFEQPFYYGPIEPLILAPINAYLNTRSSNEIYVNIINEQEVVKEITGRIKMHDKFFKYPNSAAYTKLNTIITNEKNLSQSSKLKIISYMNNSYFFSNIK